MMYRLFIFSIIFCLFSCGDEPQKSDATSGQMTMQESFAKRFPKAQEVVWDTLDVGFAALFSDEQFDYKAFFDAKGIFQYTATFIEQTALPKVVQDVLEKKFPNAEASVVMRVDNGKVQTYQIEIETNTDYINLEFDDSGKLLKEEKRPLSNEELQRQEEEGVDENDK